MSISHTQPFIDPFTKRELQILRLLAEGSTNNEIASELVLSLETIKWYNKQIYSKLGVHSRVQAISQAEKLGLLGDTSEINETSNREPPHNLPAQLTSFVGRSREVDEVKGLIEKTRFLTLTGPPGTGKTRLALQVAAGLIYHYPDGVYFIDLAPLNDALLLPNTIASVLGVRQGGAISLIESIKKYLSRKSILLIMDNFEHVLNSAPFVGEMLSSATNLTVLVTSREPLHVYGEHEYLVPPLDVPDLDQTRYTSEIFQIESIELFNHRARAVKPDFLLSESNIQDIAKICFRLDGLPLAIELAAARIKMLTPKMIRERLESRFSLLSGSLRDLPSRMRTLRGAIDWSYELLDEDEKELFAQLAVFQGGRTIDAVQAVCKLDQDKDVLVGLESLINKSLLRQTISDSGDPRFVYLETIHEYAREKLQQGGCQDEVSLRHTKYFCELAEKAEIRIFSTEQQYWYTRLKEEQDNFRTALSWSLENGRIDISLRIVGSLSEYWYQEGRVIEGQFWAERVLEESGENWISLHGRALNAAGLFAFVLGDHDTAIKYYRDALKILEQLDDRVNFAWSLVSLGYALTAFPRKTREGIRLAEQGLEHFRELGDKQMISRALNNLGEIYRTANDYENAGKVYEECILISEEIGDRHRYGINLANLAYVALNQGDYDKADALMKASFKVRQELGLQFRIAEGFAGMALPVAWMRNPLRAARLLGASEALFEALGITLQPPNQMEIDKGISAVRQQLDEVTFDRAWQEGRDMSLDEAIAYALGE